MLLKIKVPSWKVKSTLVEIIQLIDQLSTEIFSIWFVLTLIGDEQSKIDYWHSRVLVCYRSTRRNEDDLAQLGRAMAIEHFSWRIFLFSQSTSTRSSLPRIRSNVDPKLFDIFDRMDQQKCFIEKFVLVELFVKIFINKYVFVDFKSSIVSNIGEHCWKVSLGHD